MGTNTFGPFADGDYRAFAKDYIKELLANIRDAETQLRRSWFILILLAFVFALARANPSAAITIFSLRLEDLSPILTIAPVVSAFQFFNIASIVSDLQLTRGRLFNALWAAYPALKEDGWTNAILPGNSALFGPTTRVTEYSNAISGLQVARATLLTLSPLAICLTELGLYGASADWGSLWFIVPAVLVVAFAVAGVWTFVSAVKNVR